MYERFVHKNHTTYYERFYEKNTTCVLDLVIFMIRDIKNVTNSLIVLSCVIYAIIYNYVCIDYLDCQSNKLSVICMDKKYQGNSFNKLLGIVIPYLLMNLFSCRGFMKNINSTVVLLCPSRILEYIYF